MVVAQKVKEKEITEQDSLLLTRNLLRIAIFNISYVRGLFPEKYFNDKSVPALDMKVKKLLPLDDESRRLLDWMEKGVYDALQKKYLKTLLFCICESADGPMIEEYTFSFSYSNSESQEVSMNINRSGTKKGGTFNCNSSSEITPTQMRSSACKMVRTLIQLMRTLDKMPQERTVLMKLLYYDDVTPMDYEPPFFRGCTEEEAHHPWNRSPLKMEVGKINSKHLVLALKVKSVLDPCEDENNDDDNAVNLSDNSAQIDQDSEYDSEISDSDDDHYIVAPREKCQLQDDNGAAADEDDTQDLEEDELQLGLVKDWISSFHLDTIELTDVLVNFPAISAILIEEIMEKLVKEGFLSNDGDGSYTITQKKKFDFEFDAVKEEVLGEVPLINDGKDGTMSIDRMYMKALYHSLPMDYITVGKLKQKLDCDNQTTVRKLIDKMTQDGFVAASSNRRLGKRVIHSDLTTKKLIEVKKLLNGDPMELDMKEPSNMPNHPEFDTTRKKHKDLSTCGGLHSIGSDVTRTRGRSDANMDISASVRTQQENREKGGNTPISKAVPAVSRESFIPGANDGRTNGKNRQGDDMDIAIGSMSSQDRHYRKTSTVKEPIEQNFKRQRTEAA